MSWMLLWKITFIVGVTLFAVMAVWVTIAGAKDIKRLFKRIEESHEDGEA
jgi:hypothetical protein